MLDGGPPDRELATLLRELGKAELAESGYRLLMSRERHRDIATPASRPSIESREWG